MLNFEIPSSHYRAALAFLCCHYIDSYQSLPKFVCRYQKFRIVSKYHLVDLQHFLKHLCAMLTRVAFNLHTYSKIGFEVFECMQEILHENLTFLKLVLFLIFRKIFL